MISQRFPPLLLGPSGSVIETSSINQLAHDETGDNNCCKYRYQADDNGTDYCNSQLIRCAREMFRRLRRKADAIFRPRL